MAMMFPQVILPPVVDARRDRRRGRERKRRRDGEEIVTQCVYVSHVVFPQFQAIESRRGREGEGAGFFQAKRVSGGEKG